MSAIEIIFPDGAVKDFPVDTTGEDIAASISPGLKKQALAIKLDGKLLDLKRKLNHGGKFEIITNKDQEGIEVMRHSTAHLMAQAVRRIYKQVHFGVGPVIKEGFYYDMDMEHKIVPEDLPAIEKRDEAHYR
ncbi:TGS domain-containing protein [Virgibacillus halophilus]|uniref:TGS domain-containing protein n=1 Tax=Tigheibacillus halophilus TaxID=361280 RepID=A0ABU5CCA0_9BACI|nr:TGS domain-containing protein [Virgibacillus halophilus]